MSGSTRTGSRARRAPRVAGPAFPLVEAKLSVPPVREGIVPRERLLRRLRASDGRPIVAVVAPPGYGKTTLLSQWAETDGRPIVWVTVDDRDNDPSVLLTYLAAGLERIRPIDAAIFAKLASPAAPVSAVVSRLIEAIQGCDPSPLLILDDTHLLAEGPSQDAVVALAADLPPGSQLAIGGRSDISLPTSALRARRHLLEIGPDDLVLEDVEIRELLRSAEPTIPAEAVERIVERTEGWPAAAYLAALSFGSQGDRLSAFSGADRYVSDFVWSEILDRVPAKDLRFLTRTSVLDRMTGSLCDAVTGARGSADTLERLERSSLLLVPLDRRRTWYRYHQLLRDVLRAELERRERDRVADLHHRAADWFEGEGIVEAAVEHRLAAGDTERAAALIEPIAQPMYRSGRAATLRRWFGWLEEHDAIAGHPPLAVLAAWLFAMSGDAARAERWAVAAETSPYDGSLPDGSPSLDAWITVTRALRCVDGVGPMRADAERAVALIPATSFFRPVALLLLGRAMELNGESGGEVRFMDAVDAAEASDAYPLGCLALGLLAASHAAHGDWAAAEAAVARAPRLIDAARLEGYWTSALVYAVRARIALRRGDREAATADLNRTQRLRPVLTHAIPWSAVQTRLEMIRALVALPDPAGARTLLRELADIVPRCPDLGTLHGELAEVRRLVDAMPSGAPGASALTAAELRLLPYLHTYLSFRDIAQRLYVSPNTVKTQAVSLYRKLGVSSRGEAMARAEELGLIDR